jgi:vitamin B12 transporter
VFFIMRFSIFGAQLASVPAAVLALMAGVSVGAHAQTSELETVIVSATRVAQKLSDVLPSASVITREEIERSQAPTLVDLIQSQPGIEIGRNGGPGTLASIFMRGQSSNNVAVFVDGVPVQRDAFGGLKLVDIPPSQIEQIEILRGNMGALYGESAVGGAILIFTRSAASITGPTASLSLGSRSTSDLAAGYNLSHESWRMGISLQRFETQGYSAMNAGQNASVNPDKDGFERESVFVSAEKTFSSDMAVGIQVNDIRSRVEYDSDYNPFVPPPFGGPASPSDTQNSSQQSSDISVYSRFNLTPDWSSRLAVTESSFENREFYNGAPNGSFDGDQTSLRWNNTYRSTHGNMTFGAESVHARFEAFGSSYKRTTHGSYLGYSAQIGRFDYQVNIRRDEVRDRSNPMTVRATANTGLLGLGYQVTDDLKLTGLASTSFRAPSAFEFGNTPSLQPERHRGYELGLSHSSDVGVFRVVYFETLTRNAIDWIGAWNCPANCYENIAKTDNNGVELSLQGQAAGFGYRVSAVSQDPRNVSGGNIRLARRAQNYGSFGVTRAALGLDWGANVIWSGDRLDGATPNRLGSYSVVNLTASKQLTPEWALRARLENAFDRNYQLAYGYDAVPRGLFLSLQYQPR